MRTISPMLTKALARLERFDSPVAGSVPTLSGVPVCWGAPDSVLELVDATKLLLDEGGADEEDGVDEEGCGLDVDGGGGGGGGL